VEDLTGRQLGPYRIVAPLGEGGMAAVYKAYQANMDRYVALKILPRFFASDPSFVGRFEQEARVIARLQHPHILAIHDFGAAEAYTYIVMPFVEGGTLADALRRGRLDWPTIQRILRQVGDALDYAHSRGVVHRDVKPTNILVDPRGNCLLSDFGIAKIVQGTAAFTQTGASIGTPAYMSPEQIKGEDLDGRSDIYSLGIVLYEMATGRVPFQAETPPAIFVKHLHDPLPPPSTYRSDIPPGVESVILKSLSKEPEDRFSTVSEMSAALASGLTRPPAAARRTADTRPTAPVRGPISPVAQAPPPERGRGASWLPWVLGLLGVIVLAGIVIVIALSGVLGSDQGAALPATLAPTVTTGSETTTATAVATSGTATPAASDTATIQESPAAPTPTGVLSPASTTETPEPSPVPSSTTAPTGTPSPVPSATATPPPPATATWTWTPPPPPTATATWTPTPSATPTTPPPTTVGPAGLRIRGRILWADAPVAGARAQLRAGGYYDTPVLAEAAVDGAGQFMINNPPAGSYRIYAVAPSEEYWSWTSRPVDIPVGGDVDAGTFYLAKKLEMLGPADGSTVNTTTPTLSWNAYPGATRYHVDLFNDQTGDAVMRQDTSGTSLAVSPALTPGERYQWSVDAFNAAGSRLAYYSAWRFTVGP
jgi:serine/threonine protein kinase